VSNATAIRGRTVWRWTAVALLTLAGGGSAFAVSPLVTDDADPVERGHLQLNLGWQFVRTDSVSLHAIPVNPVVGVAASGELGATVGYLWRDADGVTDLTLETKWRLRQSAPERLNVSLRLDVNLPTGSEDQGLGTGRVDVDAVLIGTRTWGRTALDSNVGYTAVDAERAVFADDVWFVGQALRHQLTERWTAIGEAFGLLPNDGAPSGGFFSAGAQLQATDSLLLSVLVGTAVGRGTPDGTVYVGFTWNS
jgi:hypothetical protein